MNKYLRKNGKKIMAILGVLLMIAFALPTATSNFSRSDTTLGTIRDGKETLTGRDYRLYTNQWAVLKSEFGPIVLSAVLGGGSQLGDDQLAEVLAEPQAAGMLQQFAMMRRQDRARYFQLLQIMPTIAEMAMREEYGEQVYMQIDENPEMFLLLAKEAEGMGLGPNGDVVETVLDKRGVSQSTDPDRYAALRQALRTLLTIDNAANVAASVVKVSQPQLINRLASQRQELSVSLIEFSAKDFLDKVPAPTDQQLKEQFEKYKNVEPDLNASLAANATNPLGFGYKYPNRVKYDAVVVRKDDVRKAVPPVETEDVAEYYLRNKAQFTTATSQPAAPNPLTLQAGPTTRQQTMAEAREQIVRTLTNQRAEELTNKVRDAVRNTMRADFEAYRAAIGENGTSRPTTGKAAAAAPVSSLGVPYNSFDYLKKLRDKVQADHKVTLTIEQQDGWQTPAQLEESKLGKDGYTAPETGVAFPRFMTSRLAAFLPEEQRKDLAARGGENKPVAVWEATPAFHDNNDDLLIARATAADPSHVPATLDEVKDKVAADVKLAAAYDAAKKAAQASLDAAKAGNKWLDAVAAEQKKSLITTGLFGAPMNSMVPPLPVPGYDLKGPALTNFVQGAFKLLAQAPRPGDKAPRVLTTQPTTRPATQQAKATTAPTTAPAVVAFKDHPVGLIEIPADRKVVVAEVEQLKPIWTKDREAFFTSRTAMEARFELEQALRQSWLQYEAVTSRLGYVPTEKRERKTPRQNQPINPFTGTMMP